MSEQIGQKLLLLVESNVADAMMIMKLLREADRKSVFLVEVVDTRESVVKHLDEADVIIINLSLPDSRGINTFRSINAMCSLPVVVLTSEGEEEIGLQAVSEGAQDCLVLGQFTANTLYRSILYAIERHRRKEVEARLGTMMSVMSVLRREIGGLRTAVVDCRETIVDLQTSLREQVTPEEEGKPVPSGRTS